MGSTITNPFSMISSTFGGSNSAGARRADNRNNASDAADAYWGRVESAQNDYRNNTDQYVGNQGYQNGLKQAQKGAMSSANAAGASAAGTARSMGMSKGAAAAMGSGQTINAYNQGLANQQAMVQNNYNNMLNRESQIASTKSNAAGQDVANRINMFNAAYNNQDAVEKLHTGISGFGK